MFIMCLKQRKDVMGLLEQKEKLDKQLSEVDRKLHFYLSDGVKEHVVAFIDDIDGYFHLYNEKVNTKEDCIALCEWYLKTVKEL